MTFGLAIGLQANHLLWGGQNGMSFTSTDLSIIIISYWFHMIVPPPHHHKPPLLLSEYTHTHTRRAYTVHSQLWDKLQFVPTHHIYTEAQQQTKHERKKIALQHNNSLFIYNWQADKLTVMGEFDQFSFCCWFVVCSTHRQSKLAAVDSRNYNRVICCRQTTIYISVYHKWGGRWIQCSSLCRLTIFSRFSRICFLPFFPMYILVSLTLLNVLRFAIFCGRHCRHTTLSDEYFNSLRHKYGEARRAHCSVLTLTHIHREREASSTIRLIRTNYLHIYTRAVRWCVCVCGIYGHYEACIVYRQIMLFSKYIGGLARKHTRAA